MTTQFRYKSKRFYWPSSPHTDQQLRYAAISTFLRNQPEIMDEKLSLEDFELLWRGAQVSFYSEPTAENLLNIPSQQVWFTRKLRRRWSRANVPACDYFAEIFTFLRRKLHLTALPPNDAHQCATSLFAEPCDFTYRTCAYSGEIWYCLLPRCREPFFDDFVALLHRTACYQQNAWSMQDFQDLWETLQASCCQERPDEHITLQRSYANERWRRRVSINSLIVVAEFLHYLHARPTMSLQAFLHCFDACLPYPASQWDFWCLSSTDRIDRLSSAASAASLEPRFFHLISSLPLASFSPSVDSSFLKQQKHGLLQFLFRTSLITCAITDGILNVPFNHQNLAAYVLVQSGMEIWSC